MVLRISMKVLAILCALSLINFPIVNGRTSERKYKERQTVTKIHEGNICDMVEDDNNSPLYCYCQGKTENESVSVANCFVFGTLLKDDPLWYALSANFNLKKLDIMVKYTGELNFVPTATLTRLRHLEKLKIKYGKIKEVNSLVFGNLTHLTDLDISRNEIQVLNQYSIGELPNLTSADLSLNRIVEIKRDAFYKLPALRKLMLNKNNISSIEDRAFAHLGKLWTLDLENNSISVLIKETFNGLGKLKQLNLRSNDLSRLGDFTFDELWSLKELLLDYNVLESISERAFDGLVELKTLSLNGNRLSSLSEGLLGGVRGLNHLSIRDNHLDTMTLENIRPILDNLKNASSFIDLQGNNFDCSCQIDWMLKLRNETKSENVRQNIEQVTCHLETTLHKHLIQVKTTQKTSAILENMLPSLNAESDNDYEPFTNKKMVQSIEEYTQGEETYDDEPDSNPNNIRQQKKLVLIPLDVLPCPQDSMDLNDESFSPSHGEVKDFRNNASMISMHFISIFLISVLLKFQCV